MSVGSQNHLVTPWSGQDFQYRKWKMVGTVKTLVTSSSPKRGQELEDTEPFIQCPGTCCCFRSFSLLLMNSVRQQELPSRVHLQRPNGHLASLQGILCAGSRAPTSLLLARVILAAPFTISLPGCSDEETSSEKLDRVLAAHSAKLCLTWY